MILLILLAYLLIAVVTIFQYGEQKEEYNASRFERKENATILNISYAFNESSLEKITENIPIIFKHTIFEIASVHKVNIKMYDLKGKLLVSSVLDNEPNERLEQHEFDLLQEKGNHRLKLKKNLKGGSLQVSYAYIYDDNLNAISIMKLYYLQDNTFQDKDLQEFLFRLGFVYIIIFFIAIVFAYFLSSYITKSINTVISKMSQTGLNKKNEKIYLEVTSVEIKKLVLAYNKMVDELEDSAVKLAQSEREQAWREMAKQVAHEIKNPLTPMRLTVQSFERRFDPTDENIKEKLKEYSNTLIQQIDVMTSIASAFSDFAQMPTKRKEKLEVVSVIKTALDIFDLDTIQFTTNVEQVIVDLDKTQLIRIVTNLIQNAKQATEDIENPIISLELQDQESGIKIVVSDNGKGIDEELKEMVFEPRFTTKSSGMGLGLAMIKKIIEGYNGSINFSSTVGKGTVFTIFIPKEN
ncbi:sensor histidine kinase [Flavicella sediminum]|uniref:sensor histidine kinase n=1 Tax=Flavicella sediminum TaxID=2585141 RepID=UPI0011209DF8|nr:ATP-binding protein [Flavicella sediminum]